MACCRAESCVAGGLLAALLPLPRGRDVPHSDPKRKGATQSLAQCQGHAGKRGLRRRIRCVPERRARPGVSNPCHRLEVAVLVPPAREMLACGRLVDGRLVGQRPEWIDVRHLRRQQDVLRDVRGSRLRARQPDPAVRAFAEAYGAEKGARCGGPECGAQRRRPIEPIAEQAEVKQDTCSAWIQPVLDRSSSTSQVHHVLNRFFSFHFKGDYQL